MASRSLRFNARRPEMKEFIVGSGGYSAGFAFQPLRLRRLLPRQERQIVDGIPGAAPSRLAERSFGQVMIRAAAIC